MWLARYMNSRRVGRFGAISLPGLGKRCHFNPGIPSKFKRKLHTELSVNEMMHIIEILLSRLGENLPSVSSGTFLLTFFQIRAGMIYDFVELSLSFSRIFHLINLCMTSSILYLSPATLHVHPSFINRFCFARILTTHTLILFYRPSLDPNPTQINFVLSHLKTVSGLCLQEEIRRGESPQVLTSYVHLCT
jgi:hypothetical protein